MQTVDVCYSISVGVRMVGFSVVSNFVSSNVSRAVTADIDKSERSAAELTMCEAGWHTEATAKMGRVASS